MRKKHIEEAARQSVGVSQESNRPREESIFIRAVWAT